MFSKEIPRGWVNREITKPQQMEASLRYAVLIPPDFWGRASFYFPYYKSLGEAGDWFLHLRKREKKDLSLFRLDVGLFKKRGFYSNAWMDFVIDDQFYGAVKEPFGAAAEEISRRGFWDHDEVLRIQLEKHKSYRPYGIYVSPPLKRQRVGTTLITAARIILDQKGIKTLVLKDIDDIEGTTEEGRGRRSFYDSLGVHFLKVGKIETKNGPKMVGCAAIPTKASLLRPYRFE